MRGLVLLLLIALYVVFALAGKYLQTFANHDKIYYATNKININNRRRCAIVRRGRQMPWTLQPMWVIFSPNPHDRKCHFRFRIKNANVIFSAWVWWKIVYASREENWPAHISCLQLLVAIYTSCKLSKFFPP